MQAVSKIPKLPLNAEEQDLHKELDTFTGWVQGVDLSDYIHFTAEVGTLHFLYTQHEKQSLLVQDAPHLPEDTSSRPDPSNLKNAYFSSLTPKD